MNTFQFSSAQLCPTLCDPMDCSTPGLPVHHQLPELTQTHFHGVGDAIQPSHPLSSPSSPALNLSQLQGLLHQMAKVLELQLQHQSFQWTPSTNFLYDGLVGSPCSPRDSRESSPTSQFTSIHLRERIRWQRSRWMWRTSLSVDTSGTHLQTQNCRQQQLRADRSPWPGKRK